MDKERAPLDEPGWWKDRRVADYFGERVDDCWSSLDEQFKRYLLAFADAIIEDYRMLERVIERARVQEMIDVATVGIRAEAFEEAVASVKKCCPDDPHAMEWCCVKECEKYHRKIVDAILRRKEKP